MSQARQTEILEYVFAPIPLLSTATKPTSGINKRSMRVQSYIELDAEDRTEEQEEAFQAFCSHYLMSQYLIGSKDGREYYHCLLVDADNIPEMVSLMSARRPVVNGCWDVNGNVYNAVQYPFDLDLHLLQTPPEQSVTLVDGKERITETEVTEFLPLHGYSGWLFPVEY